MGRSFSNKSTVPKTPVQWTEEVPHKYCGKLDHGRSGKPNKAHRCEACIAIKAREHKLRDGPGDIKAGRQEKMRWLTGEL